MQVGEEDSSTDDEDGTRHADKGGFENRGAGERLRSITWMDPIILGSRLRGANAMKYLLKR